MGFGGYNWEGFKPLEEAPTASKILIDSNPTQISRGGGGAGIKTLTDTNPSQVTADIEPALATLIDRNPSQVSQGGGGLGVKILMDSNPSVTIT